MAQPAKCVMTGTTSRLQRKHASCAGRTSPTVYSAGIAQLASTAKSGITSTRLISHAKDVTHTALHVTPPTATPASMDTISP